MLPTSTTVLCHLRLQDSTGLHCNVQEDRNATKHYHTEMHYQRGSLSLALLETCISLLPRIPNLTKPWPALWTGFQFSVFISYSFRYEKTDDTGQMLLIFYSHAHTRTMIWDEYELHIAAKHPAIQRLELQCYPSRLQMLSLLDAGTFWSSLFAEDGATHI